MSFDNLKKIADKFERKIAQQMQLSQKGTTELFFDSEQNQRAFANSVQSEGGMLAKFLTNVFTKTQKPTSFNFSVKANPKQGAEVILNVEPANIKPNVLKLLNDEFSKITGKSLSDKLKEATKEALNGNGSGELNIASLNLE